MWKELFFWHTAEKSVSSHELKEYSVFVLLVHDVSQSYILGVQAKIHKTWTSVELISSSLFSLFS